MNKIDTLNWKEFIIGDLFEIKRPVSRSQSQYEEGDVPFVASGNYNNGVLKYLKPKENEQLDKGNCITVSPVDGSAFYQEKDFLGRGGAGSSIILLYNSNLNLYNGYFIATIIRKVCEKYLYNDMGSKDTIKSEKIKLPVDETGSPDFSYMETYMKNLDASVSSSLTTLASAKECEQKCNISKWINFEIGFIFEILNGKGITAKEIYEHPGNMRAIQSGEENFGCIGMIDEQYVKEKGYAYTTKHCLSVARSGSSGYVGIQTSPCVVGDSAKLLLPKVEISINSLVFLRAILMINKKNYSYNDKVTKEKYEKDIIKLPSKDGKNPDYEYMDNYISSNLEKYSNYFCILKSLPHN